MSSLYGPISIVGGVTATQTNMIAYPDTAAIVVFNESPYFINVSFGSSGGIALAAYTADITTISQGFVGTAVITSVPYLAVGSGAPASVVFLQTISYNEQLAKSLVKGVATGYPITLTRLSNIGNAIAVGTSVTNLINDGNALATQIIESTPTGAASSTISVNNDGSVLLRGDIAGTLTTWLQFVVATGAVSIGQAGNPMNILGNALFPGGGIGSVVAKDVMDFSGASTIIKTRGANTIQLNGGNGISLPGATRVASSEASPGNLIDWTATDAYFKGLNGSFIYQSPSGTTKWSRQAEGVFSGTGNGTVATGVTNPTIVLTNPCTVSGSSQTIGMTNATNTVVTTGAGLAWSGIAIHI